MVIFNSYVKLPEGTSPPFQDTPSLIILLRIPLYSYRISPLYPHQTISNSVNPINASLRILMWDHRAWNPFGTWSTFMGGSIYAMNSNPKGRCRKYWRETQFHHVIKFTSSNYHIFSIIYLCSETMISSNKNVHVRHGCLLVALEGAITGPSFSNDLGKASNWSPRIGHKTNIHGQNLHFHG
jgi:hypothetical protein